MISTSAVLVQLVEEDEGSDDEIDTQSMTSHHSYLDMNKLKDLKKTKRLTSKSSSEENICDDSTDDSDVDESKDGDYEKMKKLCKYREKGPPMRKNDAESVPKRCGKVINSEDAPKESKTIKGALRQDAKSRVFQSPEPYKYEISNEDCTAMLKNIRGEEARRQVIWNVKTPEKEYNYMTTAAEDDNRSSDLGKVPHNDPDYTKPHHISVFFDDTSRTDSIGGCSDLARMSYISALDGIYRTTASYCASDGSVNYAYTFNGQGCIWKRISTDFLNETQQKLHSANNHPNGSNLTLDSGLSIEHESEGGAVCSKLQANAIQVSICELELPPNVSDASDVSELRDFQSRLSKIHQSSDGVQMRVGNRRTTQTSLFVLQADNSINMSYSKYPEQDENKIHLTTGNADDYKLYANCAEIRRT